MRGRAILDLTNQVFGRLRVLGLAGVNKWGNAIWQVECECGTVKTVRSGDLLKRRKDGTPNTTSCGCKKFERSAEHWTGVEAHA